MFYDLNVRVQNTPNAVSSLESVIERLCKNGFRGVALTTEVDESIFEKNKKDKESRKKGSGNSDPNNVLPLPLDMSELKLKFSKVRLYTRLNIIVNDSSNIRRFTQCKNLKKYDLISFQPESQNVLKSLSGIADLDIITYNPENKCSLSINRKLYNQFVNQNVYFELKYAPAIMDSTARRNLLTLSHSYRAVGRSKNIIVSSGADTAAYVRGPNDIINFNLLFGLSEEQSKSSISQNCDKLLLRARKQRRHKSTVEMVRTKDSTITSIAMDITERKEVQPISCKNELIFS